MTLTAREEIPHNPNWLKTILLLTALEGLPALAWFFWLPSESGAAVFAGLSATRLALVVGAFAFDALIWGALIWSLRRPAWIERTQSGLDRLLLGERLLAPLVLSLAILCLAELALLAGVGSVTPANYLEVNNRLGPYFPLGYALAIRFLPLLAWAGIFMLQTEVWLARHYRHPLAQWTTWGVGRILTTLFAWLVIALTIAHWGILLLKLRTLHDIAGYYWGITYRPLGARDGLFLALAVVLAAGLGWALKRPAGPSWRWLPFVFGVGFSLVLAVGFVSGQGLESLRQRYAQTGHSQYAQFAAEYSGGLGGAIRDYDALYSHSMFTRTKPPGVMVAYIALEKTINAIAPSADPAQRFTRLTGVIGWLFPLVGLLAVIGLFFFVLKIVLPPDASAAALLAPALFILAPNILLLGQFMDQALYPMLFLAGALLIVLTFRQQSAWLAALTGAYLYLAAFLTFSMLPLFGFAGLYAAIDAWLRWKERPLWGNLRLLVAVAAGTLALFAVFALAFDYTVLPRLQMASTVVHNYDFYLRVNLDPNHPVTDFSGRVAQIAQADFLNNVEFAAAVGVPLFGLFLLRAVKLIVAFIRRRVTPADGIQGAFLGTFLALNVLGTMRGEAARLWMFWVPMVVIFAAVEIAPQVRRRAWLFALLALAQIITLVLTFHFQDLHVV